MPKTEPFEKHSEAYDAWFERNRAIYEAELKLIENLLPRNISNALEVGVGTGRFAAPLGIKNGVEPAEKMAEMAEKRGVDVRRGVAENLPFPDATFDLVLMVTTVCFVDDILRSFQEAFRVLMPGGGVVVGFVDKESDQGKRYLEKKANSDFYRHATFVSTTSVLKKLRKAGFETIDIKQSLIPGQNPDVIASGFGKGGFVAVKAKR